MKYVSAKKSGDVVLDGVKVEFVVRDNVIVEVHLSDGNGHSAVVATPGQYTNRLDVYVPASEAEIAKDRFETNVADPVQAALSISEVDEP